MLLLLLFESALAHLDVRGSHSFAKFPQHRRRAFPESLDRARPLPDAAQHVESYVDRRCCRRPVVAWRDESSTSEQRMRAAFKNSTFFLFDAGGRVWSARLLRCRSSSCNRPRRPVRYGLASLPEISASLLPGSIERRLRHQRRR